MDHARAKFDAALVVFVLLGAAPSALLAQTAASGAVAADSVAMPPITLAAAPGRDADLGPTSDPPWNPPRALHSRQTWEQVLLFPGAVASVPLQLLAVGMDRGLLYVEQTALIQRLSYVTRVLPERAGIQPEIASLGDRTGLGIRVEARAPFFGGKLRNVVRVAHSASTRHYHRTEVRLLGKLLQLDYGNEWRPSERFYGIGMGSSEDSIADYASHSERVRLLFDHGWNREDERTRTRIGAWIAPRTMVTRRGREAGKLSIEERFPSLVDPILGRPVEHLTYGARFATDWRTGVPHWSNGWRLLVEAERFDRPLEWLALRNGRGDGAQFTRLTLEGETGISFYRDPRTIRVMARVIDQGVTAGAERMMMADLSGLGGREGLWGFQPGRFHDLDQALVRLSYVYPLARRFEVDLHAETGGVFPDLWGGARMDAMEVSFGAALRGRLKHHPIGSIGVDACREGVRVRYMLGNPE